MNNKNELMKADIKYKHSILSKPVNEQYEIIYQKGKSILLKHLLLNSKGDEYTQLLMVGKLLSSVYRKIEMLPSLNEMEVEFRNKIMPGVKNNKNPDFRIDGIFWEMENPTLPYKYKKIDQRIRKGYQQANHIILYFERHVNGFTVQKAIKDRMEINKELSEVIIIVKNAIVGHIKRKPGK